MTLKLCLLIDLAEKSWKNHAENMHQTLVLDSLLILVNDPKEALHARNSFKSKIF